MDSSTHTIEDFFYGSATIGERGQIVIPAEARKDCSMNPGDKLLVFRHPMHPHMLMLGRVADMKRVHEQVTRAMEHLYSQLQKESVDEEE